MKGAIINYYLEVNTSIIFLVMLYLLFFRNEQNFSFKRIYLSGSLLLSLVLPLIQLNTPHNPISAITRLIQTYTLPEITVTAKGLSAGMTALPQTSQLIT